MAKQGAKGVRQAQKLLPLISTNFDDDKAAEILRFLLHDLGLKNVVAKSVVIDLVKAAAKQGFVEGGKVLLEAAPSIVPSLPKSLDLSIFGVQREESAPKSVKKRSREEQPSANDQSDAAGSASTTIEPAKRQRRR